MSQANQSVLAFCDEYEVAMQFANLPEDLRTKEMLLQLRLTNAEENHRKHDLECAIRLDRIINGTPTHEFKQPVLSYKSTAPEREQQNVEGYQAPARQLPAGIHPNFDSVWTKPVVSERQQQNVEGYQPRQPERKVREQKDLEGYQTPPRQTRVEVPPAPRKQVVWATPAPNQLVSAARYLDFNQSANPAGDAAWGRILAQRHQKQSDAFRARARQ
jgi:hypothetical protein